MDAAAAAWIVSYWWSFRDVPKAALKRQQQQQECKRSLERQKKERGETGARRYDLDRGQYSVMLFLSEIDLSPIFGVLRIRTAKKISTDSHAVMAISRGGMTGEERESEIAFSEAALLLLYLLPTTGTWSSISFPFPPYLLQTSRRARRRPLTRARRGFPVRRLGPPPS